MKRRASRTTHPMLNVPNLSVAHLLRKYFSMRSTPHHSGDTREGNITWNSLT